MRNPGPNGRRERVVVASSRLPLSLRRSAETWRVERSSGGLATAMRPILAQTGGIWIGWPGDSPRRPDPRRDAILSEWRAKEGIVAVELPARTARGFYEGFANQTLWPLFHHFPSGVVFESGGWEAFTEANRRFLDTLLAHLREGDLVWVHDYHLMLLPRMLREARPGARIGFFLHIPFPSSEVFRILPRREELLHGLLGADLLVFQTHGHLQHFRTSLLRILGIDSRMDRVDVGGRTTRLEALPIGIDPQELTRLLDSDPRTARRLHQLRARFEGKQLLLAVDRLDYTKGIPERLRAFRRLLEGAPDLRGRVVLIQVAVPSREAIPRYGELRREVNELVGEIVGDFGTPDWTPLVYVRRSVPRPELAALYAASDVGWVTPLRDGMNLVAKEYVACQRGAAGVLLLSEFAGAAAEMGEAFIVNPYDEERTAVVLEHALREPEGERRDRMETLYRRVVRNDVFAWGRRFLALLRETSGNQASTADGPRVLPVQALAEAVLAASRVWIFLDYDGTLVPFAGRPRDAAPTPRVLDLIGQLARRRSFRVALVSGRPKEDLDTWFGEIDGLWLAAEHGAAVRAPGGSWEPLRPSHPVGWKARVRPVLEHVSDRTPGSFIEEKEYSLVWHYRMAHPEFGEWLANDLTAMLEGMLAETELRALRGQKSVEVRLAWANKGELGARLISAEPGLILAVGDDRTDEDLFERLPADAWTVHVGSGPSRARFRLADPEAVLSALEALVA